MYFVIYNAHCGPVGGGEHYVYNIAKSLRHLGHYVELVYRPNIDMESYLGFDAGFTLWDARSRPDVFIAASH